MHQRFTMKRLASDREFMFNKHNSGRQRKKKMWRENKINVEVSELNSQSYVRQNSKSITREANKSFIKTPTSNGRHRHGKQFTAIKWKRCWDKVWSDAELSDKGKKTDRYNTQLPRMKFPKRFPSQPLQCFHFRSHNFLHPRKAAQKLNEKQQTFWKEKRIISRSVFWLKLFEHENKANLCRTQSWKNRNEVKSYLKAEFVCIKHGALW